MMSGGLVEIQDLLCMFLAMLLVLVKHLTTWASIKRHSVSPPRFGIVQRCPQSHGTGAQMLGRLVRTNKPQREESKLVSMAPEAISRILEATDDHKSTPELY